MRGLTRLIEDLFMRILNIVSVALLSMIAACVESPAPAQSAPDDEAEPAAAVSSTVQASTLSGGISPNDLGRGCGYVCSTNAITGYPSGLCAKECPGGFVNCAPQAPPCP